MKKTTGGPGVGGLPVVGELYKRKCEYRFKEVAVDVEAEVAVLELSHAFGNGEAEAVAFGVSRAVAAGEALHEFFFGHVEGLAGGVFKGDDGFSVLLFEGQVNAGPGKGIFADVVHEVVKDAPHSAAVCKDAEFFFGHFCDECEFGVFKFFLVFTGGLGKKYGGIAGGEDDLKVPGGGF